MVHLAAQAERRREIAKRGCKCCYWLGNTTLERRNGSSADLEATARQSVVEGLHKVFLGNSRMRLQAVLDPAATSASSLRLADAAAKT